MVVGHIAICVDGCRVGAHRLAWFYVYGVWPPDQVDHINLVKDDNRLSNLRLATASGNAINRGRRRDNKSGIKGVSWSKEMRKWTACIRIPGGPWKHLGRFSSKEDAAKAYADAAFKYHGEFARLA